MRSSLYTPLSFHVFFSLCPFSCTFVHSLLLSTYLRPVLFVLFIFYISPLSFLQPFCSSIPAHLPAFLFIFLCICCSRVRLFISSSVHFPLCSFSPSSSSFFYCIHPFIIFASGNHRIFVSRDLPARHFSTCRLELFLISIRLERLLCVG